MKKTLMSLTFLFVFQSAWALVDYPDYSEKSKSNMDINQAVPSENKSTPLIWKSNLSLESNYEFLDYENEKWGIMNFNTHIQTPFNLFVDASFWQANIKGIHSGSFSGNPKFGLGFNWIRIGGPNDEALLNIMAAAQFASDSVVASSRNDKIFGLETTKKFGVFGLGLGYQLTLTGTPKREMDMNVGNIQKIEFSAGWIVSNDIQFEVSAENYKVLAGQSQHQNYLEKNISFSALSPKLNLELSRGIHFELGARYRMQRAVTQQKISGAKLFDLHGLYGNSVFTGLNLSI